MIIDIMLLILGLAVLVLGGELLVRGASSIALVWGVSPLVIGLTVVAFGTSAPEAAVSILSSLQGIAGVAIGNIIGSNIFNILVVLGFSALIAPLSVHQQVIHFEAPLGVGVTLLLAGLSFDGVISRFDGIFLFSGILVYTFWAIRKSRTEPVEIQQEYAKEFGRSAQPNGHIAFQLLFIIGGVGLLVFGSDLLVKGASSMARRMGVSDLVIGLTIIAAGTSLPELATSIIATIRGEKDIAVGNVIGSNLFNILCVLGLVGLIARHGFPVPPRVLHCDLWIMLGASALVLPVFFTGYRISRWEGAIFIIFYILYLGFLVLFESGHPGLARFIAFAFFFVVQMVTLIIGTVIYQLLHIKKERRSMSIGIRKK
ncbi:MAG: calcium/sodium antiporter [bacterium]